MFGASGLSLPPSFSKNRCRRKAKSAISFSLAEEYNREPSQAEVFKRTHFKRKEGVWASLRAQNIAKGYNSKLGVGLSSEQEAESSTVGEGSRQNQPPPDDLNAWLEVTKGVKKGRVVGFGPREYSHKILKLVRMVSSQSSESCAESQTDAATEVERFRRNVLPFVRDELQDLFVQMAQAMGWTPPPQTNNPSACNDSDNGDNEYVGGDE